MIIDGAIARPCTAILNMDLRTVLDRAYLSATISRFEDGPFRMGNVAGRKGSSKERSAEDF